MTRLTHPATLSAVDRLSRRSERHSSSSSHHYQGHFTPRTQPVSTNSASHGEHGNITTSETKPDDRARISLTDPRWAGLTVHSIAMGFISTMLPLTVYPFLTVYLNMEGTQTLSARALLVVPWVLRPFYQAVMACTPAIGSNRFRKFLALGWAIAAFGLCAAYATEIPDPYFPHKTMKSKPMGQVTPAELATMNLDAPTNGAVYVMLMTVTTVGFILADVASDALVQQVANEHFPQLDPRADSPFVDAMTSARLAAMLVAFLFMGFGMSGENYGGDFDFTLSYNDVMLVAGIISAIPLPFALFMIDEQAMTRSSFVGFLQMVWSIFHHRGMNLIIGCRFIGGVLGGMSATPVTPIAYYWAGIQPLNDNVVSFVAISAVIFGIRYAEKKGWTLDYLKLIIFANLGVLAIDCVLSMSTTWNVLRTQWLWIGLPVMESLPSAVEFLILNVIVSEIADPDSKDLTREIVTAVSFLAGSLGIVATKLIDAPFHVSNDDILRDTDNVRGDATATFLIAYCAQLLSVAWLYVLPRHEHAAREWKIRHTATSAPLGAMLVVVLLLSLGGSVAIHILSVNASTSCLWIAGASGCDKFKQYFL